ncbi:MAG: hypothetical protein AAF438_05535 [Pseudomonadota bacterium]
MSSLVDHVHFGLAKVSQKDSTMNESNNSPAKVESTDISHFGIDDRLHACMGEVTEVLRKYGLDGRIGLSILHNHFPVADDEIMFEHVDEENREQTFKPAKRSDLDPDDVFVSIWDPSNGRAMGCCPRTHGCHLNLEDLPKWHV